MAKSSFDNGEFQAKKSTLDPLSFTKAEAEEMLGRELIGLVESGNLELAAGDRSVVVSTRRDVNFRGDKHEYLVGIQWTDREGNLSEMDFHTKEQIHLYTRGLSLADRIKSFGHKAKTKNFENSSYGPKKRLGRKL